MVRFNVIKLIITGVNGVYSLYIGSKSIQFILKS